MGRWLIAGWLLVAAGVARAQPVQGDVRAVGFRTPGQSGFALREGQWFPTLVELSAAGSEHQEIELRCAQTDLDGDHVAFMTERVTLTGGGGPVRRLWCYAVTFTNLSYQQRLDVLGADGVLINSFDLPAFDVLSNDEVLILDVSARPVTALRRIGSQPGNNDRRYYRNVVVGQMPAAELPDRWWGLEAVDVIVWDEPSFDPQTVSRAQLDALLGWVRNGGELVVGLGASWPRVRKSPLAEIIPLRADAAPVATRVLENFFRNLAGPGVEEFDAPIPVAVARAPRGAVTFKERLRPTAPPFDLIATHLVGSGRVTAVAASLRDLTSVAPRLVGDADTPALFLWLFDLNPHTPEFIKSEAGSMRMLSPEPLFAHLVKPTEFGQRAGLLMLAAVAFVTVYMALSTLVSWAWLRRRGLTRLSWTVFAAFAVLASAVSVGAVGLSRGVFGRVRTLALIDVEGGSSDARAMCLFGYRSPRRQRVDLTLPGDGHYLRALTRGPGYTSQYATAARYTAVPRAALLRDTLMRATLKQFEGFWEGPLDGSVRAQLVADARSGRITARSWIQNDLDINLAGGYLLYLDPRLPAGVERAAGHTSAYRPGYKGARAVPPAINVLAVRLPPIDAGKQVRNLGAREYAAYDQAWQRWRLRSPEQRDPKKEPEDLLTLWHRQRQWVTDLSSPLGISRSGFDETAAAALLVSTRNLYLHSTGDFNKVGTPLTTAGLVDRDISHWLLRGQAVLLLLADDPGPAVLYGDGDPLRSERGRSLYRVRVPIRYAVGLERGTAP